MDVAGLAAVASALADATRLRVLDLADGRHTIGKIAAELGVTGSDVSYHVRVLAHAGLITLERRGRRTLPRRVQDAWRLLARALR